MLLRGVPRAYDYISCHSERSEESTSINRRVNPTVKFSD